MKKRKAIAYVYPTSENARKLGVSRKGGYYVQQSVMREDGTWSPPYIEQGHDVFSRADDPDLLALFREADGEIDPSFKKYGPAAVLKALKNNPRRRKGSHRKKNPSRFGFKIVARRGTGPKMHYDGHKFTTNGAPFLFKESSRAVMTAQSLIARYPMLERYHVTVQSTVLPKR